MRNFSNPLLMIFLILSLLFPQILLATFVPPEAIKITTEGKNRQPIYVSNSGFVYISQGREHHKDPQLYFKDIEQKKEKQISHQRGHIANGFYFDGTNKLFFTSSTDEEKETPFILKKYLDRFPSSVKNDSFFQVNFAPQEVYESKIDGTQIKRLTHFSGYDGFPAYLPTQNRLFFSRWSRGKLSLYAKSLTKDLAPWKVTKTSGHDLGLQLAPDKKRFAWFRFSPDFKSSQIITSDSSFKNTTYLTLENGVNWSPTWHPNGKSILYSAKNSGHNNFDLYEVSLDGECKRQITAYSGDEFFPAISPDGKNILFTSTMSGNEQIYKISYPGVMSCKKSL